MPTRRIRLAPRTPYIGVPLGSECTGQSGTATAALLGSATYPNEPPGLTSLGATSFAGWTTTFPAQNQLVEGMRRERATPRPTYGVTDGTAPFAGLTVLEWKIPSTQNQGTGPENIFNTTGNTAESIIAAVGNCQTLYVHFWLKVVNGYKHSNGNGLQKLGHIWCHQDGIAGGVGGSTVVPGFTGSTSTVVSPGTNRPSLHIRFQGMSTAHNVASAFNLGESLKDINGAVIVPAPYGGAKVTLEPDTWYRTEWLLVMNTPGSANGQAYLWVNGVLRQAVTDLCYKNSATGSQRFTQLQWNNTYGGILGTTPGQDSFYRWADYHASGA